MIINKEIIQKLEPCEDRFENYLKHYSEFNGTVEEFLNLDKISYKDKAWVLSCLLTKEQGIKWALLWAKHIPIEVLKAAQHWLDNPNQETTEILTRTVTNTTTYVNKIDDSYVATTADVIAATAYVAVNVTAKRKRLNLEFLKQALRGQV